MAFDFKKEYRQFYRPGTKPGIVTIPKMNYLAVKGKGDPEKLKTVIRHPVKKRSEA